MVFGASRKLVAVLAIFASTVVISGVARAEPEQSGVEKVEARAAVGITQQNNASVSSGQYNTESSDTNGTSVNKVQERNERVESTTATSDEAEEADEAVIREAPEPSSPPETTGPSPSTGPVDQGSGSERDLSPSPVAPAPSAESANRGLDRRSARQAPPSSETPPRDTAARSVGTQDAERDVSREATSAPDSQASVRAPETPRKVESPEIERRVQEFQAQDRAGKLPPAATGYGEARRGQELRIAREQIFAEPVDKATLRKYKRLYEQAAEEYEFGDDWYVLAAVGKVESDHGQNLGPSSAGALGPMQFMPSTWASYGLDANDDGRANIMDPEDAIPAAARYLSAGGAPEDWYKAMYTYNHAGWYVEKVLKVAEKYRQAVGDDEVGPYYPDEIR